MLWQTLLLETQLLSRLVESFIAPPPPVRKSTTAQFLQVLAVVLACLAVAALGVGTYMWMRETYTLRETAVYMGSLGIVLALLCGGVAWVIENKRYIRAKIAGKVVKHKVSNLYEAVTDEFSDTVREYPKTTAAVAAILGLVAANKVKAMSEEGDLPLFTHENAEKVKGAIRDFVH